MSEWQPIETAPKDGTRVLLHKDGHQVVAAWSNTWSDMLRSSTDDWWIGQSLPFRDPTHWMMLPEPPED